MELYQDMPLPIPNKESNDIESYRRLEEARRYSNKELRVNREIIERARDPREYATIGQLELFRNESCVPGIAYNPFVDEGQAMLTSTLNKL